MPVLRVRRKHLSPVPSIHPPNQLSIVTLIGEAVFARCLSALKEERVRASKVIAGPQKEPFRGDKQLFIDDLEQALYASKIISYTQGFLLMRQTAKDVGPPSSQGYAYILTATHVARLAPQLRRHCQYVARRLHHQGTHAFLLLAVCSLVTQSVFLSDITKAFNKDKELESLLFDDFFNKGTF